MRDINVPRAVSQQVYFSFVFIRRLSRLEHLIDLSLTADGRFVIKGWRLETFKDLEKEYVLLWGLMGK